VTTTLPATDDGEETAEVFTCTLLMLNESTVAWTPLMVTTGLSFISRSNCQPVTLTIEQVLNTADDGVTEKSIPPGWIDLPYFM
jgi:hypothetical protein